MPRRSLQLNDFSGGLNTKSSPRDIAPNQVQSVNNAVLSNAGLITSSNSGTTKIASAEEIEIRSNRTFSFNTQYDITRTSGTKFEYQSVPKEVIISHETVSSVGSLNFFTRNFNSTGDFTRTTSNSLSNYDEPVFYYVDGALYIADAKHLEGFDIAYFARTSLRFIDTIRFGENTAKWLYDGAVATTADSKANISDAASFSDPTVLNVDGEFEVIYDVEDSSGGGGWEAGDYEFSYTYVDLSGDESLPHSWGTAPSAASLSAGHFFTAIGVKINITNAFREKEKGFRIYIRRKDKNERWNVFLDVDYERGVRKNLFDDYSSWSVTGTYDAGSGTNTAEVTGLVAEAPALDTYDSITGYSHDEDSIDIDGYLDACVAQRRAWVCNVSKEDRVFDDRIYYTPVNRFNTFPDSYYLDIGINDGDSFRAIESLGNKVIAFKKSKVYIINISSSSDAGWYLEAEYDGHGCDTPQSVCKTPFGICWVNRDGVFLYNGQSIPVEISQNLSDDTWLSDITDGSGVLNNVSLAFNNKYKQLYVAQNISSTSETKVFVYDFAKNGWTILNRGAYTQSEYVHLSDGVYALEIDEDAGTGTLDNVTVKKYELLDVGTNTMTVKTKDLDFGNPGLVKRVNRVFVTCKDDGEDTDLALKYYNDGKTSTHTGSLAAQQINSSDYKVLEFTIDSGDRNCESMAFELISSHGGGTSGAKIYVNDINIDYRLTNKRPQ